MGSFTWTAAIAGAALAWPAVRAGTAYAVSPGPAGRQPDVPAGPEPVDGWTESAAETAASDPPVEEQYIEAVSAAWPRVPPEGAQMQDKVGREQAVREPYDPSDWDGDEGERIVEPEAGRPQP
jgi:hypothetical protein